MIRFRQLMISIAAIMLLFACNNTPDAPQKPVDPDQPEVPVTPPAPVDPKQNIGMKIVEPEKLWIQQGASINVSVSFEAEPKEKQLEYKVEDENIASISESGELTALKQGQTFVFVKNVKGKEQAFAKITVAGTIPEGVEHTETAIVKWPAELIPADGIIILPAGIESIGRSAFIKATQLQEILLPSSLKTIDSRAFMESGLKKIVIPKGVELKSSAFQSCEQLAELTLSEGVSFKSWNYNFFTKCTALKSVKIPESINSLPENTFLDCSSLQKVELPASLQKVEPNVFKGCISLKEMILPESNEHFMIKDATLFSKDLSTLIFFLPGTEVDSYEMPQEVTEIKYAAFSKVKQLKKLTLGENVRKIAYDAFDNLEGSGTLKQIISKINPDEIKVVGRNRVIQYDGELLVPAEYLTAYTESIAWSKAKIKTIE